ncbi:hypothetical protein ACQP25_29700 [Microtetraspora malaysiensis]|uniref:hypothetical protein n=1 Tax=Microtetraspora malaysiensis TaxID=161358 RepID=UPI003D90FE9E
MPDHALIDLGEAFQVGAAGFADEHGLNREEVEWLIALDQAGYPHREVFFSKVRDHFLLSDQSRNCKAATRSACRTSFAVGLS